ncbi:MAG: carbon storage regulator [Holosporales bacterium]|jgi:carbon storage regulator|nr:carbon storage regulator [Holosporales bacterium]
MLYLSRKTGQSIIINGDVEVVISEIQGGRVKIGIQSPENYVIWRKEIFDGVKSKNKKTQEAEQLLKAVYARKEADYDSATKVAQDDVIALSA